MNFGDFDIDFKNLKKVFVTVVRPYWDQFWKILILKFWLDHKVTINHRGGILILYQILMKLKNLKFDEIGNFGELRNLDFDKICEIWHRSPKSNHQFG